jgi:hypothetical protein
MNRDRARSLHNAALVVIGGEARKVVVVLEHFAEGGLLGNRSASCLGACYDELGLADKFLHKTVGGAVAGLGVSPLAGGGQRVDNKARGFLLVFLDEIHGFKLFD